MHQQIRLRARKPITRAGADARQQTRVTTEALRAAAARYEAGATLRDVAPTLGVSRQRLASLLRARGVQLRRRRPETIEVDEMVRYYARGDSLERTGSRLGFSAGTVRSHLLARGIAMRDCHGQERSGVNLPE